MIMRTEQFQIRYAKSRLLLAFLLALGSEISYAADTGKGAALYATNCASCHGKGAVGGSGAQHGDVVKAY